tara:strand:- start:1122 stop:1307 length:186 start_codon:yes stop_codon:yes gene_type:complete
MSLKEVFNFKPGDLVKKSRGHHKGKSGIILEVNTNSLGNTIVIVLSDRLVRKWYANFVEYI